jgi:arylsulfatase A-like enzyme
MSQLERRAGTLRRVAVALVAGASVAALLGGVLYRLASGDARDVYGEVVETPLILSSPSRLEPGIAVQARTENVDLWPALLELVGLPPLTDVDGGRWCRRSSPQRTASRGQKPTG